MRIFPPFLLAFAASALLCAQDAPHTNSSRSSAGGSATGQWTKALLTEADVDLPITTEYHEVAILKNPMDMRGEGSACIDSILCVYFRSEGHDKTLVGAFTGKRGVDPDNFSQRASEESLAAMAHGWKRQMRDHFAWLHSASL